MHAGRAGCHVKAICGFYATYREHVWEVVLSSVVNVGYKVSCIITVTWSANIDLTLAIAGHACSVKCVPTTYLSSHPRYTHCH